MKNILALTICLASVCAGRHIEDATPPSVVPEASDFGILVDNDNSTTGNCFDCDYNTFDPENNTYYPPRVVPHLFNGVEYSYLEAQKIVDLISDHDAGRPLDFCVVMDLLIQFQEFLDEQSYIQNLYGEWPEEQRAKVISKIELLPKCTEEGVSPCDSRKCFLKRRMTISAMRGEMWEREFKEIATAKDIIIY